MSIDIMTIFTGLSFSYLSYIHVYLDIWVVFDTTTSLYIYTNYSISYMYNHVSNIHLLTFFFHSAKGTSYVTAAVPFEVPPQKLGWVHMICGFGKICRRTFHDFPQTIGTCFSRSWEVVIEFETIPKCSMLGIFTYTFISFECGHFSPIVGK